MIVLFTGTVAFALLFVFWPAPETPSPNETEQAFGPEHEFRNQILPLLERRCAAGCHGLEAADHAQLASAPQHGGFFFFPYDAITGCIPRDNQSVSAAYRASLGLEEAEPRILLGEPPEFSTLLRKTVAQLHGGLPHGGLEVFAGPDDPDYQRLRHWIAAEIAGRPVSQPLLPEPTAYFRDHVLGVLERNACFLASCHGSMAFNDLKLVAPTPMAPRYSRRMVEANRRAMLGEVTRFANLGGDLTQSRLIRKNLPIAKGGIHQRGGNDQFFDSLQDPDVLVLLRWLALERAALASRLRIASEPVAEGDLGKLRAIAFIRGPRHTPRRFFDADTFYPGSDVWLVPMAADGTSPSGEPVNLTAHLHDEPVEIQGLDVRYDGRAIVFSMRTSPERGFRLYELALDPHRMAGGNFRQLSFGDARLPDGTLVHHLDPCYMPGPDDHDGTRLDLAAVAFASNAAGGWVASGPFAL
ncbi:MAG: hypothetical protein IT463_14260, partial [Planctomycetes bacterium]|nr:hypothetical protein [Planctomycetota bacterium]